MQVIKKNQVLPLVKHYLPTNPIIVEAGAFDGRDTKELTTCWPQAAIHAFEPVPAIFEMLARNVAHLAQVTCYPCALSNSTGPAIFYVSESPERPGKPFQAGSLLAPKERLNWSSATYPETIQVPTVTLDEWAEEHNLDHIDFLWLDMQGFELNVLKASTHILPTVKVIYTEVEFVEAYAGQYLYADVKTWLEHNGFTMIAKDFVDETSWFFGNAVFVRSIMLQAH